MKVFSFRSIFGWLLVAVLLGSCGSADSGGSSGGPSVRPVCLTTRCAQIFDGLGVDAKFFPIYGSTYKDPDPHKGLSEYLATGDADLVVDIGPRPGYGPSSLDLPKGLKVLLLGDQGLPDLYLDIQKIGNAVDREVEAKRLIGQLKEAERSAVPPGDGKMTAVWINGSDEGEQFYFINQAIAPGEGYQVLEKLFVVGIDGLTDKAVLALSLDELVVVDPDVIFFSNTFSDAGVPSLVVSDPRWKGLKAVKSNQTLLIRSTDLQGFGPRDYLDFYDAVKSLSR